MLPKTLGGSRLVTAALVNLAAIVERADEAILPALYLYIGRSLGASPSQLGSLTLCRALVQALASPLSGLLGDAFDRIQAREVRAFDSMPI